MAVDELPAALLARARAYLAGAGPHPPPARPSATVVLLRDTSAGPEVYLLRRVAGMAFAAGMYVFPGGVVDPRDADEALPWAGPRPGQWGRRLAADEALTRALACAAVRETFEECGVLLAGPAAKTGPPTVVADTTGADWEDDRRALIDRSLAFSDLLTRRGLVLRADLIQPWAHWITPEFEARRYDTRFFVAALPEGQRTRDVGGEADRVSWARPAAAVAGWQRGQLAMLPPTVTTLRELAAFPSAAAALAAAPARSIRPLLPRAVPVDDGIHLALPGDPDYPGDPDSPGNPDHPGDPDAAGGLDSPGYHRGPAGPDG